MTTIDNALARLRAAQSELNALSTWEEQERLDYPDQCTNRILASDIGGRLAVEYYGECWEDSWELVQRCLAAPTVAPYVAVLRLSGPDEGANGLRSWDFANLLEGDTAFPNLKNFYLRPTGVQDHNQCVVEDGQLPALLDRCPNLVELTIPQAPESAFFSAEFPRLQRIRIGMAHRTHGFIRHLADCTSLPALRALDFSDSLGFTLLESQPPDWDSTPFEDYQALFDANLFDQIRLLQLRNTRLDEVQLRTLQLRRPDCNFSVSLEAPHVYVSHFGKSGFSYRHLIIDSGR